MKDEKNNESQNELKSRKKNKSEKIKKNESEFFDYKYFFSKFGIFFGIIAVLFSILLYFSIVSQKSWKNNLKPVLESVLDENFPNEWYVENFVQIQNPLSMNAACYNARNRKTGDNCLAVLIRCQTFYGPVASVFLCDSKNNVSYVGTSSMHGLLKDEFNKESYDSRIQYWKKRIPKIIGVENSFSDGEEK